MDEKGRRRQQGVPKMSTPLFYRMLYALNVSGCGGVGPWDLLWRQAENPVKVELEKLKQKIRQLLVDNFNITIADILPHDSARALRVGILQKVARLVNQKKIVRQDS
jgi:hypothetical protein